MKAEVESRVAYVDGLHENTIVVQGVYHRVLRNAAEAEKDTLKSIIVHMMENINLLKRKAGIGTVEEIARAKKVEAEKKKEGEDRKRTNEDKVEAERRAKLHKEEKNRKRSAKELIVVEEENPGRREEQARAKV